MPLQSENTNAASMLEPVDEDREFGDAVAHIDSVVAIYAEKITALPVDFLVVRAG